MSLLVVFVPSLQQAVCVLQGLWILVNSLEVLPIVFDQGAICIAIHVHDKLYTKESHRAFDNKLYSFNGHEIIRTDVIFLAHYLHDGVPVHGVVKLLDNLLHSFEFFKVCGEIYCMLCSG